MATKEAASEDDVETLLANFGRPYPMGPWASRSNLAVNILRARAAEGDTEAAQILLARGWDR